MSEFEENLEHENDDLIQRLESMWQSPPQSGRLLSSSSCTAKPAIKGYRIDEIIGIGGMAVVYRAWDETLKRFVALKMLSRPTLPQPTIAARFRQEALAAAQLSHPGIVPGLCRWRFRWHAVVCYVAGRGHDVGAADRDP